MEYVDDTLLFKNENNIMFIFDKFNSFRKILNLQ